MLVLPVKAIPLICELDIVKEEGVDPQLGLIELEVQGHGLNLHEGGIILS